MTGGGTPRGIARLLHVFPIVAFRGLNGGMPMLIGLFIGHQWGLASLGDYMFAAAFLAVGLMIVDWGCTRWLPRELAVARVQGSEAVAAATANTIRLLLAAALLLTTSLLSVTGFIPHGSIRFALELGLLYPTSVFTVNGVSDRIVVREIGGIAVATTVGLAVFGAGLWGALHFSQGPHAVVMSYVIGKAVEAALLMRGRAGLFRLASRRLVPVALALWPFSIQAILGVTYSRLSVFIVEHFRPADLGLIGAASALQNFVLLFPVSIALLQYPAVTTCAATGAWRRMRRIMTMAAVGSVAAVAVTLVVLFAVREQIGAALHIPSQWLLFVIVYVATVPFLTTGVLLSIVVLQSIGREQTTARLAFAMLGISVTLQYVLVRTFGLWGVAAALAGAEALSMAMYAGAAWIALREIQRRGAAPLAVPAPEALQH